MNSVFSFVVGLLTAALSLLGFVQQHPELPQVQKDQAQVVAQQAITQATKALNSAPTPISVNGNQKKQTLIISFKIKVGTPTTVTLKVGDTATDGVLEIKLSKLDVNRFGQSIATTYVNADVNNEAYNPGGGYFGTAVGGIVGVKEGFHYSAVPTGVILMKVTDISLSNNSATIQISAENLPVSPGGPALPTFPTARIDATSLVDSWDTKTISGSATGVNALAILVAVEGYENSSDRQYVPYFNTDVPVTNGRWAIVIQKGDYACNKYSVIVFSPNKTPLATGTFRGNACGD